MIPPHLLTTCFPPLLCSSSRWGKKQRDKRKKEKKTQNRELNFSPPNRFNRSSPCCSSDCWRSQQDKVGQVQQEASLRWKASERPMHNEWMANRQNAKVDKSSLKCAEQFWGSKGFFSSFFWKDDKVGKRKSLVSSARKSWENRHPHCLFVI